ncbi:Mu-like prophage major head subunit gpT family protein [Ancylobacter sp.]|uniref:phage major capsid protein n=1 Tax=Ancylobacter sp. TaxID=1872567 RepID=UPI003BAC4231
MPVNASAIRDLLLPGLRGIEGEYKMIPTQWDKVFERGTSRMAVERTVEARFLGLAALKSEGGSVYFDNAAGERFVYNQRHVELGLGYAITQIAMEDNLYKDQFRADSLGLYKSMAQTKEILGANVLNTATTYNPQIGGDGVALCATNHPVDGATWANKPTVDVDLTEAALQNAAIAIRYFPDQANLRVMARPDKLVVPPQLEYVARRLLDSDLRPGTSDNDVNAMKATGYLNNGYTVMDFLTSAYAWFVTTDIKGLLYLQRREVESDMQVDFATKNLLVTATERYSFGYKNPRSIYGSFPSS